MNRIMPPTPETQEAAKQAVETAFIAKNLFPTIWLIGVAVAGGVVAFYQKVKAGKARAFNVAELMGEVFTSALVGLITYWICRGFGVNEYLTAAAVGITGHMGARALFMAEQWIERRVRAAK